MPNCKPNFLTKISGITRPFFNPENLSLKTWFTRTGLKHFGLKSFESIRETEYFGITFWAENTTSNCAALQSSQQNLTNSAHQKK